MKFLILSDIHGQKISLQEILKRAKEQYAVQYCFVAGDITNFGSEKDVGIILDLITTYIEKVFYVLGNCDPIIYSRNKSDVAVFVENFPYKLNDFTIVGFGNHKPRISENLLKKLKRNKTKVCLLTHIPPYRTAADMVSFNKHGGSRELKVILQKYPNIFLHICGHIHESAAITKVDNTVIINPGPVNTGNYAIIDIDDSFNVKGKIYNINGD